MAIRIHFAGVLFLAALLAQGLAFGAQPAKVHPVQAEETPVPKVRAETIFDVQAFVPGKSANMIVVLNVPEEWHIYWANAGETGMPTTVEVSGPKGWNIGSPRFPGPVLYLDDQGNRSYVLEGQVAFFIPIVPPDGAVVGDVAEFELSMDWLLCKGVCHSGGFQAKPKLPIAGGLPVANPDPRIDPLRRALPRQGFEPLGIGVSLGGTAEAADLTFFSLDGREFEFFASPASPLVVTERHSESKAESRSQRTFRLKPALGAKPTQIQVVGVLRTVVQDQVLYYEVHYQGELNRQPAKEPVESGSPPVPSKESASGR